MLYIKRQKHMGPIKTLNKVTKVVALLWPRHYPLYYDVTTPSTMTSLPPLL